MKSCGQLKKLQLCRKAGGASIKVIKQLYEQKHHCLVATFIEWEKLTLSKLQQELTYDIYIAAKRRICPVFTQ